MLLTLALNVLIIYRGLVGGIERLAKIAEQGKRLKSVADEIETLEGRWLEISTQIDALAGPDA